MAFGSVAACVHGAAIPVFFVFFGKIINIAGTAYLFPTLVSRKIAKYSLEFVYLGIVVLFSSWTEVACWMYTGERQAAKMRLACLKSMLSQDISFFDTETSTGEITSAMTSDILVVQDAISEKAGNFIHFITRFITGFIIGFIQLWQISLVTLSIVPLIAVAGGVYAYTFTGLISKIQNSYLKAGEIAEEVISNIRSIKAFVGEEKALKSYSEALAKTYEYGKKGGLVKGMGLGAVLAVIALSWALLVWFGSITIHRGVSNGGETFTTMLNVVFAGLSLGMAAQNIPTFLRARTASYSIFKMIEKNTLNNVNTKNRNGKIPNQIKGDIRFKDVFFSYPSRPEAIILNKFNLNIPSGKIVAIVGGSGSGKSTVISLLERFYEPQFGEILLDNQNIKNLDLKWLRRQIGLVNQEPSLFATTIRENILYGKNDATDDEINRAADLSDSLSFINNLPHKFETHVGERGIQISGGQKQRIAISRAILKDPSILLLDEATSSLDSESEQSVQQALDRVMVGRTTVVVAHRLTTVRNADIIAVISNGHIVESGTHDQLKSNPKSIYANLIHLQQTPAIQPQSAVFSNGNCSQRIGSFRSERDSVSIYPPETEEKFKVRKKVSWSRMYSMASPDWLFGLIGIFSSFISGSLIPLFALAITDALVAYYMDWETTQKEIKRISLLICAGAVVSVTSNIMEHLNFGIVGERLTLRVRETMFASILKNEIGWFDNANHTSSTLSSRLATDARLLKTIVVDRSSILMENLSLVVTSFIIAFILNWRVTLVVLATFPLQIAGHLSEKFFIQGYGGNLSKAYLKANMLAGEAVGNIRTVSAFCLEEKIIELYSNELSEPSKHSFRRGQIAGVFYGVAQCSIFCSFGLSLWYGSTLMEKGISSFKSVIKCFMVLTITALGMAETLAMAPDLVKGNHMVASVFEVIDRKTQISEDAGEEVEKIEGNIELKKVGFCYPSRLDVKIFEDFDLKVQAGTSMALVGSSGSGKTSVISLILRFYDPTEGKVLIDGKDIRSLQLKSLRKQIGLVQQEPALFATTIYDNILYGKDDATETEIVEAAKLANAHSFITGLPEGYSTKVGERGVQLSGGQKQRIAIARAVLKDPTILLLDEATSALDMESERVVQKAIENLMMNRTTIAVAHRLSTVKNANLISVLQNGKIVEQGNHEELIQNKNGAYYKLINLQKNEVF